MKSTAISTKVADRVTTHFTKRLFFAADAGSGVEDETDVDTAALLGDVSVEFEQVLPSLF
jgi:hypothetical protein